jgi:hypothetical protein
MRIYPIGDQEIGGLDRSLVFSMPLLFGLVLIIVEPYFRQSSFARAANRRGVNFPLSFCQKIKLSFLPSVMHMPLQKKPHQSLNFS